MSCLGSRAHIVAISRETAVGGWRFGNDDDGENYHFIIALTDLNP